MNENECVAVDWFGPCPTKPTTEVMRGCRHEHCARRFVCDYHRDNVQLAHCGPCSDIDGHRCAIKIKVLGPVTP